MKRCVYGLLPLFITMIGCRPTKQADAPQLPQSQVQVDSKVPNAASIEPSIAGADATEATPALNNQPAPTDTANTPNNPAPAPQAPAGPAVTHKVAVTCTNEVRLDFTFNGVTANLSFGKGPQINGQPSSLLLTSCPKILTALNGKSFPVATTVSKPSGGTKVNANCNVGGLTLNVLEGDPNGTFSALSKGVDLESVDVCLQIRNVINALNL